MCLGEYGTVAEVLDVGRAVVHLASGARVVSLAVLAAEGTRVAPGDIVMVSMGMALAVLDDDDVERSIEMDQEVIG